MWMWRCGLQILRFEGDKASSGLKNDSSFVAASNAVNGASHFHETSLHFTNRSHCFDHENVTFYVQKKMCYSEGVWWD